MKKIIWMVVLGAVMVCCTACGKKQGELVMLEEVDITQNAESSKVPADEDHEEADITSEAAAEMDRSDQCGEEVDITNICVHVCGAVLYPGVYEVSATARVYEAIEAAGGVMEDAAGDYLNQAAAMTDGQRIYVPTADEVEEGTAPTELAGTSLMQAASDAVTVSAADTMVNINTATAEQLKSLPGIGDSRAQSIIAYRDAKGGFQTKEEIMQVDGIKEGMYSKMKDMIQVQ